MYYNSVLYIYKTVRFLYIIVILFVTLDCKASSRRVFPLSKFPMVDLEASFELLLSIFVLPVHLIAILRENVIFRDQNRPPSSRAARDRRGFFYEKSEVLRLTAALSLSSSVALHLSLSISFLSLSLSLFFSSAFVSSFSPTSVDYFCFPRSSPIPTLSVFSSFSVFVSQCFLSRSLSLFFFSLLASRANPLSRSSWPRPSVSRAVKRKVYKDLSVFRAFVS